MSKQSHSFKVDDRVVVTVDEPSSYSDDMFLYKAGDAGVIDGFGTDNRGDYARVKFDIKRHLDSVWFPLIGNIKLESTTTPITEQEFKIRFYPTPASDFHGLERNRENLIKATAHSLNKWTGLDGVKFKTDHIGCDECALCVINSTRKDGREADCDICPVVRSGGLKCGSIESAWRKSNSNSASTQPMRNALLETLHWLMDDSNSLEPAKSKVVDVWPVKGDSYFIVDEDGSATECVYHDHGFDVLRAEVGNFYRTREEAMLVAKRRKLIVKYEALCKRLWDERGEVIDWGNSDQGKWNLTIHQNDCIGSSYTSRYCGLPSSRYHPKESFGTISDEFSKAELWLIVTGEER